MTALQGHALAASSTHAVETSAETPGQSAGTRAAVESLTQDWRHRLCSLPDRWLLQEARLPSSARCFKLIRFSVAFFTCLNEPVPARCTVETYFNISFRASLATSHCAILINFVGLSHLYGRKADLADRFRIMRALLKKPTCEMCAKKEKYNENNTSCCDA